VGRRLNGRRDHLAFVDALYHELHTEDPVSDLSILENLNFTLRWG